MLDVTIKKVENTTVVAENVDLSAIDGKEQAVEMVARPVFDPKLNFWYTGTPAALEEPLVDINPQIQGKMPWESGTTEPSDDLIFDPKLNFWYSKRAEKVSPKDEEAEAASTREKMEREGRAIVEEEKAKAKEEEEKRARAAASVYEQMRLKAIEDSKAEAAAKIKAAKETKVMEELMKKKEELETKIGKNQTKPKAGDQGVTVEACVMGQRQLAKKKKEEMEKKLEEVEKTEPTSEKESNKVAEKKTFSLPMDDDSDDWMIDDDVGEMIEEDEEDENEKAKEKSAESKEVKKEESKEEGAKKVAFSLPMDDNSDDWMCDDDVGAMIEDEEEGKTIKTAKEDSSGKEQEKGNPELAEKKCLALPLDDASDDWMLDDDVGTMIEEEEEETENAQKEKVPSSKSPKVETEVTETDLKEEKEIPSSGAGSAVENEAAQKKSFSLPLDDASDDWMLDDDMGGAMEEEKPGTSREDSGKERKEESEDLEKKTTCGDLKMEETQSIPPKQESTEKQGAQAQKKSKKNKNKKK